MKITDVKNIGLEIRKRRKALGYTQADIAAMLEAEKIAKDVSVKGYKDLDELFEELDSK